MSYCKYNISKQVKIIILRKPASCLCTFIITYKFIRHSKKIVYLPYVYYY